MLSGLLRFLYCNNATIKVGMPTPKPTHMPTPMLILSDDERGEVMRAVSRDVVELRVGVNDADEEIFVGTTARAVW
jgi:hypothetical protein